MLDPTFGGWIGAPGRIRTHDPLVRSQVLYPTELRARSKPASIALLETFSWLISQASLT